MTVEVPKHFRNVKLGLLNLTEGQRLRVDPGTFSRSLCEEWTRYPLDSMHGILIQTVSVATGDYRFEEVRCLAPLVHGET